MMSFGNRNSRSAGDLGPRAFALAAFLLCACWPFQVQSQAIYDFEQSTTSWELSETNCSIPSTEWLHQRTTADSHGGSSSEHFQFLAGHGTKILVTHPIPPAYLIDELRPKIWIKSNRPDLRVMLRVVLPHAPAPDGSGPIRVMLEGETYKSAGSWQELGFATRSASLMSRFQQQLWMLRTKYGAEIDPREAYTDLIVLNLYSAPGACDVWVDDLRIDGIASATQIARRVEARTPRRIVDPLVRQVSGQDDDLKSLVRFDGNIMEIAGQPFLARVIQHNGEPFEFLKGLGFNTIELRGTADLAQLQQAAALDLWLVCPPPANTGLQPIGLEYDRVLAWSAGRNLDGRGLETVRNLVREIRHSDARNDRPIVADVASNWSDYGKMVSILAVGLDTPGGTFPLYRYDQWLAQRQALAGRSVPLWGALATELPVEIQSQVASMSDRVPPTPLDARQMESALFELIAGGVRGIRFLSRSRLDASDPATLLRAQIIKWLNIRIDQCEPWIAGGAVLGRLPLEQADLDVTAVQTDRARLLLVQRRTGLEQWVAGDLPLEKVSFVDVGASSADKAYWLSPSGVVPLPVSNVYGGAEIEIEKCPSNACIAITESPVIVNRLAASYQAATGESYSQLRADICRNWLALSQLLDREMGRQGRSDPISSRAINDAITYLQQSETMSQRNNALLSDEYLSEVEQRLALSRKQVLAVARMPFGSQGASPLLVHPLLVPNHWSLATRLADATWQPNALAGGDFENLEHMVANGWTNRRTQLPDLNTKVELTPNAAIAGKLGMELTASSTRSATEPIENTPVWITTGNIPVKSGQLVRIHGWVRAPQALRGSLDGLMIIDSLGGPAMAERILQSSQWQEFTLYRGVPADGDLNITFALTGLGIAMIDEVTVRIADSMPTPFTAQQPRDSR